MFKNYWGRWSLGIFIFFAVNLATLPQGFALTTKEKQLRALHTIIDELDTHYGMAKFKKEQFGVTLPDLEYKYSQLIELALTLEEALELTPRQTRTILSPAQFRQLMVALAGEFRDGHLNITKLDPNAATVGLHTAAINDRLYVVNVDPAIVVDTTAKPLQLGDEIVEVNGLSVQELASRNMLYVPSGTYASRKVAALEWILRVPYALFPAKKEGDLVEIKFRRNGEDFVGQFHWIERKDYETLKMLFSNRGRPIAFDGLSAQIADKDSSEGPDSAQPYWFGQRGTRASYFQKGIEALHQDVVIDLGEGLNADLKRAGNEIQPVTRLSATMVRHQGLNVGILRLPDYNPGSLRAAMNEYMWVAKIIERMENLTDVLIIDQLSNTGGSLFYMNQLLSLFAQDEPLSAVSSDYRLNETLLQSIYETPYTISKPSDTGQGQYTDMRLKKLTAEKFRKMIESGEQWTGLMPTTELGWVADLYSKSGQIFPSRQSKYSKPIVLLNDTRSASGGDFFPRILQANSRAVIFGSTSSGLGGPVWRSADSLPGSEMSMRCTSAYCEIGGEFLENVGAVPDVYYDISLEDLQSGFALYSQQALNVATLLAAGQNAKDIQKIYGQVLFGSGNEAVTTFREFVEGHQEILNAVPETEEAQEQYAQVLQAVYQQIKEWHDLVAKDVGPFDSLVDLPLPQLLLREDPILRSLFKPTEVINRLQEMQFRPKYENRPQAKALMNKLVEVISSFPEEVTYGHPCAQLLTAHK